MLSKKKKSLAEEINNLMTTVPTNFDSDEDELTKAKTVECDDSEFSEEEYRTSSIRTKTAPLLDEEDERYAGKKISRRAAFGNKSDEESSGELTDENQTISEEESISESDDEASEKNSQSASDFEENSEDGESESERDNSFQGDVDGKKGIEIISNSHHNSEIEKGKSVKYQLERWEKLLKTRILLQKCLAVSNEMPQFDVHETFMSDPKTEVLKAKAISETSKLLDNLLELQNHFLKNNSEMKNFVSTGNKRKVEDEEEILSDDDPMNEEIPSDSEDDENEIDGSGQDDSRDSSEIDVKKPKKMKLDDYEKVIAHNHKAFSQYRDSVIQKFDNKTRISSGKSNKGSQNQSILRQIEFILNDRERLLKRTRLKRSNYNVLGKKNTCEMDEDGRHVQEYDPEIFDDDDFYQQLLREVIESKSSENTDPVQLSRQWAQLQNMRSKMKRNIDTRATKGRRIRYVVHQKLVNFMAPVTYNDSWTDNAKNELYNSLFGKSLNSCK